MKELYAHHKIGVDGMVIEHGQAGTTTPGNGNGNGNGNGHGTVPEIDGAEMPLAILVVFCFVLLIRALRRKNETKT